MNSVKATKHKDRDEKKKASERIGSNLNIMGTACLVLFFIPVIRVYILLLSVLVIRVSSRLNKNKTALWGRTSLVQNIPFNPVNSQRNESG